MPIDEIQAEGELAERLDLIGSELKALAESLRARPYAVIEKRLDTALLDLHAAAWAGHCIYSGPETALSLLRGIGDLPR
jgi:hypothetical protein